MWIGLHEPSEDEFDSIQREFELHELAVEDAINAHQRPKIETYGDTTFLVLKTARYIDPDEIVQFGEILVFLGHDFIVTVRHGEASSLTGVRENLESRPDLLAHGPGAVLHSIVDRVVDDYFPAVAGLRRTSRRSRTRSSRPSGPTRPSASTGSSARCSSSTARPLR